MNTWKTNDEVRGAWMVTAGAVLISFSAVFVKLADVSATMAGFYRTLFGGAVLLAIALYRRRRIWKGPAYFNLALLCAVLFALDLYFWHRSIHFVGPGLATILANFQVFILALFGVLVLKERLGPRMLVAIPLALFGLFLLAGVRWNTLASAYKWGLLLGVVAAGCYAGYILALRRLQSLPGTPASVVNLTIVSFATALLLGLYGWHQGDSFAIPDVGSVLSLISYGIVSQGIGWILITGGLPHIRPSLAGLLLLLQPSLSFTWDILFFQRPTDLFAAVGAALTLTAIYLGSTRRSRKD